MGTLHKVYQLKPKVIISGAILRIKKDQENLFSEKYNVDKNLYNKRQGIFSNTGVTNSTDGKIERYAIYANEKIIDFEKSGLYISIQDGSKYGFEKDFNEFLSEMSPYLEDALFYVFWDTIIYRYEIINGKLYFESTENFANWNYSFEEYILANYFSSQQIIADFYIEETDEMILRYTERIKYDDDPKEFYEVEEYEDMLTKINHYKEYISIERFTELEYWLKTQIDNY
jgi:hypothetical protein